MRHYLEEFPIFEGKTAFDDRLAYIDDFLQDLDYESWNWDHEPLEQSVDGFADCCYIHAEPEVVAELIKVWYDMGDGAGPNEDFDFDHPIGKDWMFSTEKEKWIPFTTFQ